MAPPPPQSPPPSATSTPRDLSTPRYTPPQSVVPSPTAVTQSPTRDTFAQRGDTTLQSIASPKNSQSGATQLTQSAPRSSPHRSLPRSNSGRWSPHPRRLSQERLSLVSQETHDSPDEERWMEWIDSGRSSPSVNMELQPMQLSRPASAASGSIGPSKVSKSVLSKFAVQL